jgi:predicted nuclease with TOPRIM domain
MLKEKNIKITSMGSELEEIRKENNNLTLKLAKSEDEKLEWMEKHDKLKLKLEEGKTNFIKQITGKIGEFLAKVLGGE